MMTSNRAARERRVLKAADVLTAFLTGLKIQWTGIHGGPHYFVPPHRVRPLMNACNALSRISRPQSRARGRGRK